MEGAKNVKHGEQEVTSFVLRFCPLDQEKEQWRIKVTHVQEQNEVSFCRLEEAFQYIKKSIGMEGE